MIITCMYACMYAYINFKIRILGISHQATVKYIHSLVANTSPTGKGLACMTEWIEMYILQKGNI